MGEEGVYRQAVDGICCSSSDLHAERASRTSSSRGMGK